MTRYPERILKRLAGALLRALVRDRAPRERIPGKPPRSILVIRQHNQLGDMLCVVPLLRALRLRYPRARVALLTSPVNYEVMLGNRHLDEVLLYDKRDFLRKGMARFFKFLGYLRSLRARSFDMVIVPATVSMSFTSDLLALATGAPVRIGPASIDGRANPSAFVYTEAVALDWRNDPARHQTRRNMDVAASLDLPEVDQSIEMTLTEQERGEGRKFLDSAFPGVGIVIGLHPGAGKPPNRWPPERFSALIQWLTGELDASVVVTVGPMDDETLSRLESRLTPMVQVIQRQPVRVVASILSQVNVLISNDTGIMHVGAACGVPVLSLFGPTEDRQWAPQGRLHTVLKGKGGDIRQISVEDVKAAVRKTLTTLGLVERVPEWPDNEGGR